MSKHFCIMFIVEDLRVNSYFDKQRPGVNNFDKKAKPLIIEPGRGER